jgi:hypothetical protein
MSECGYLYVCVHGAIYARVSMHALSHTYVSVTSVLLAFYYIYTCKRICALYIHTYYVIGHVLAVYIHTVLVYRVCILTLVHHNLLPHRTLYTYILCNRACTCCLHLHCVCIYECMHYAFDILSQLEHIAFIAGFVASFIETYMCTTCACVCDISSE